jgi:hypothetical protein
MVASSPTQQPEHATHSTAGQPCSVATASAVPLRHATVPENSLLKSPWPTAASQLPLFLTQGQLAHLLGKSIRTLERDRIIGHSIPFTKVGRRVLYARDDVIRHLAAASFRSTREAKLAVELQDVAPPQQIDPDASAAPRALACLGNEV